MRTRRTKRTKAASPSAAVSGTIPSPIAQWAAACGVDAAELAALLAHVPTTRAEMAANIAEMDADPERQAEIAQLDRELDGASWEAFRQAELEHGC